MNHASYLSDLVTDVLKSGHWMIRADTDGVAHGGFEWAEQGEWTEAPDWDPEPVRGGGLHGQTKDFGGFISRGNRLLFCEYDPGDVVTLENKIKVRRARILLVNDLPKGLSFNGSLDLEGCTLPDGFTIGNVGGYLYLGDCTLPDGFTIGNVGGWLDLRGCTLPDGFTIGNVGGSLYLSRCTLPDGFTIGNVGGTLYLGGCNLPDGTSASGMSKADFLKRFRRQQ